MSAKSYLDFGNITFIFDKLSDNLITFVRMWSFLQIKVMVNHEKLLFRKRGCLHNCAEIFQARNFYYAI